MYVVTAKEMGCIDKRAIEEYDIPGIVLMENAAIRAVEVIMDEYDIYKKNVIVLVGGGNNGGDGLAIARHLYLSGACVEVFLTFPPDKSKGDAKINLQCAEKLSIPMNYILEKADIVHLENSLKHGDIIIDALFGTGLSQNVRGISKYVIETVGRYFLPVVAIDIPSGIDGSTGRYMGCAIKASHTVTFGYPKQGHLLYPGRTYTGKLHVVPISLPDDSAEAIGISTFTLDKTEAANFLKYRPQYSHKGTFGRVGVLAGSTGFTGAAYLTSMAAQRSGSGLVTLGVPQGIQPIMANKLTEVMTYPLSDDGTGHFSKDAAVEIVRFLEDKDVLALGPGMGTGEDLFDLIMHILSEIDISIVIDADGLNNISNDVHVLSRYDAPIVLTPHPGEMARLINRSIEYVMENPVEVALSLSKDIGAVVLLKGATSVIANSDGRVYINTTGNSGMATGGSGDVLTGIVASLMAQGYDAFYAAVLGSFIHGMAGDMAADDKGEVGVIAHDILDTIPYVFKSLYNYKD